jgi:hypothetical protein
MFNLESLSVIIKVVKLSKAKIEECKRHDNALSDKR